ncbi:MAG: hypothetical protein MZU91_08040 [Desulfosudis oleivorans]|nr:hypothetical protein [Desulfosudis oleivorans]
MRLNARWWSARRVRSCPRTCRSSAAQPWRPPAADHSRGCRKGAHPADPEAIITGTSPAAPASWASTGRRSSAKSNATHSGRTHENACTAPHPDRPDRRRRPAAAGGGRPRDPAGVPGFAEVEAAPLGSLRLPSTPAASSITQRRSCSGWRRPRRPTPFECWRSPMWTSSFPS